MHIICLLFIGTLQITSKLSVFKKLHIFYLSYCESKLQARLRWLAVSLAGAHRAESSMLPVAEAKGSTEPHLGRICLQTHLPDG